MPKKRDKDKAKRQHTRPTEDEAARNMEADAKLQLLPLKDYLIMCRTASRWSVRIRDPVIRMTLPPIHLISQPLYAFKFGGMIEKEDEDLM